MAKVLRNAALCLLAATPVAQKVGTHVAEEHPEMAIYECTASSCSKEEKSVVLDSNWRWVHDGQYTNCYKDGDWNKELCPDPETCAKKCHLDGAGLKEYADTYGIHASGEGLTLDFVSKGEYSTNYGSRVYLMDNEHEYKVFHLKNREFALTVDMRRMPCGLNAAVYFVEMDQDGGKKRSGGSNVAGAQYGTGYCDAQCPHDMKFINGQANSDGWNATSNPPIGKKGICCAEMDIWEANSRATAYTPHPCSITGPYACEGKECGDNEKNERYDGVCDKDGCDFNSYRMGNHSFYGRAKATDDFNINSKEKLTVVTQFITSDGTDTGELVDIKRIYYQDGQRINNSFSLLAHVTGNSITDAFCDAMKQEFHDVNDFKLKGGLKAMGEALDRGMVLVMSLWDDSLSNMLWLDSKYPLDKADGYPGVERGPCRTDTGTPAYLRRKYPRASVTYSDIKVGPIDSTMLSSSSGSGNSDDPWGDDRRLAEAVHI